MYPSQVTNTYTADRDMGQCRKRERCYQQVKTNFNNKESLNIELCVLELLRWSTLGPFLLAELWYPFGNMVPRVAMSPQMRIREQNR
jgi:hypothetical protein